MDRPAAVNSIVKKVSLLLEDGNGRVVLLLGAAGSGKTTAALALHRERTNSAGMGSLLLCPNAATCEYLRREAARDGARAQAGGVSTFDALAGRILVAVGTTATALTAFRRHLLLRRVLQNLHAQGELTALHTVADTPGLPDVLDAAIAELKRSAVEPDDLARAIGGERGKSHDLLTVYRRYQQSLHAQNVHDAEGRLWLARDALRENRNFSAGELGLGNAQYLVLDGFTDFTPTQLQIVSLLATRLRGVLFTLPYIEDDPRRRMWHWTDRTRRRLQAEFGDRLSKCVLPLRDTTDHPVLARARSVFRHDDAATPTDGLRVIAAAGAESEVRAVARSIKALLRGAPAGRPPRIAVLARSLDAYREEIRAVFAEACLPIPDAPQPLASSPVVRFCLDVAALPTPQRPMEPGFSYRQVLGVLRNSYFDPAALGAFDARTVEDAEWLIRENNVLHGREAYAAAVDRYCLRAQCLCDEDDNENAELPMSPEQARHAGAMLNALFDLVDANAPLPNRVAMLPERLGLRHVVARLPEAELVARDLRALDTLAATLEQIDDAPSQHELRRLLTHRTLPPPRGEAMVDVLDVLDARAMRWDHVFLLGCGEGQFPQSLAERTLLSETDRRRWCDDGVVLDRRRDLLAREMLLFYLAVSRAEQTLTLSYQHSDATGRAAGPGGFLQTYTQPLGGLDQLAAIGRHVHIAPGAFTVPAEEQLTPREQLAGCISAWFESDVASAAPTATPTPNVRALLPRVAAGLWAYHQRWRPGEYNEYDGRLRDPALHAALQDRFGPQAVFSASQLGTFGQCPWRFFARYVLDLSPLSEPQRQLQAVSEGIFCHEVLCETYLRLAEQTGRPVVLADCPPETIQAALQAAFDAASARIEQRQPPYPLLWEVQKQQMRRRLEDYLRAERRRPWRCESLHFELGFGLRRPDEQTDLASRAEPVHIPLGKSHLRLKGKIDRVDCIDAPAGPGLLVVDYKTGRLPARTAIHRGSNLQLPLYRRAAEQLLGQHALGGAFHGLAEDAATWFAECKPRAGVLTDDTKYAEQDGAAMETVASFLNAIRTGRFDLAPGDAAACAHCPYRQICHVSPARLQRKADAEGGQP